MQQIADINEKLESQGFNPMSAIQSGINNPSVIQPGITNIPVIQPETNNTPVAHGVSGSTKPITFGDTIINISGSVDDVTLSKIEDMIKEENERMLKEITNGI